MKRETTREAPPQATPYDAEIALARNPDSSQSESRRAIRLLGERRGYLARAAESRARDEAVADLVTLSELIVRVVTNDLELSASERTRLVSDFRAALKRAQAKPQRCISPKQMGV